ncbi:MAG: DMT family transporter [Phenylobacterium sp.]|uniref:DMT family transporter n=1 Tax=Phenylobacterium sp. TaxID=1871053 RepID=UPI0027369253|nr:DMT family transporter [Phenylobacterium sp.]MDP3175475.1 DMT family transporter [Phenylobacterium sp.]
MVARTPGPLNTGVVMALASAALFGASTPFAKRLLGEGVDPWLLAGLLYLGSGLGLSGLRLALRREFAAANSEASLRRGDLPVLGLVVLLGGAIGPVLLMWGLTRTSASSAALLLNAEGIATMVIAWVVFRENVDRRLLAGAAAIIGGAVVLSWRGGPEGVGLGALAILGACMAWGADNNLTSRLSWADPTQIAIAKGLAAGGVNVVIAFAMGAATPTGAAAVQAALLGFLGYGLSLVLFVQALRRLGAARTGAYFSTAPFIGAALAVVLLGDRVTAQLLIAGALMAIGVYLHLSERHEHEHEHSPLTHAHRHTHDAHHEHIHAAGESVSEPHSHTHHHGVMRHRHPHYPDLHHRHGHGHGGR